MKTMKKTFDVEAVVAKELDRLQMIANDNLPKEFLGTVIINGNKLKTILDNIPALIAQDFAFHTIPEYLMNRILKEST